MPLSERGTSPRSHGQSSEVRWWAILIAISALCFLGPGANLAVAKSLPTGVTILDTVSASDSSVAASRVKASGAKFVVLWLRWDKVAPPIKPAIWDPTNPADSHYDWGEVDQWINAVRGERLQPILQLYGAPEWANRCTAPDLGFYSLCNPDPNAMGEFAEAAARRYSGDFSDLPRVRYWQIQNEPNLHVFFNPQFNRAGRMLSPNLFRRLLAVGYKSIKGVDPANVVLAGGLAPNGVEGSIAPMTFTRKLLCMNRRNRPRPSPNACDGGVKFDVFDVHPYTSGGPTRKARGKNNIQLGDLPELKRLLTAADKAGHIDGDRNRTPLWVTEMSWDSRPPDPGGVKMSILTRWVSEAMYRASKAGVSAFFWYSLRDRPRGTGLWSESDQAGLYFRRSSIELDRPKRSLKAFRFPFVAFPKGRRRHRRGGIVWGRTPSGKGGRVVIQVARKSRWRRVAVRRANAHGVFRGFVHSRYLSRKRGAVRAVHRGQKSVAFSLKPVKDFFVRPFG